MSAPTKAKPAMPEAALGIDHEVKQVMVCAWCEADKRRVEAWAAANGYEVSHGMCPRCYAINLLGDP